MTTHSRQPDRHGESLLAAYFHARSSPVAEWLYRHTEWVAAVAVFLLTVTSVNPRLAALVAVVIASGMFVAAVVVSLRGSAGNCDRIIAEVQARQSGEDGAE